MQTNPPPSFLPLKHLDYHSRLYQQLHHELTLTITASCTTQPRPAPPRFPVKTRLSHVQGRGRAFVIQKWLGLAVSLYAKLQGLFYKVLFTKCYFTSSLYANRPPKNPLRDTQRINPELAKAKADTQLYTNEQAEQPQ